MSDSNLITGQYLQSTEPLISEEANHPIVLVLNTFLQENFFNFLFGLVILQSHKEGHPITPTVHSSKQGKDTPSDTSLAARFNASGRQVNPQNAAKSKNFNILTPLPHRHLPENIQKTPLTAPNDRVEHPPKPKHKPPNNNKLACMHHKPTAIGGPSPSNKLE